MIKKIIVLAIFLSMFSSTVHALLGGEVGNGGIYVTTTISQPPSSK